MVKHYNITVSGRVQGVFFRANTQKKAEETGVSGFVLNKSDGSVYIEAEAEEAALIKFTDWCRVGPPKARVERVDISEGALKKFKGFEIKR